jgi:K+-transporting ATPase c subunit
LGSKPQVTGIPLDSLKSIVNQNEEGTLWIFGSPYMNVLRINLALMKAYLTQKVLAISAE